MAATGSSDAFAVLYDRYFDRLCAFAMTFMKDEDQSQDMVQDVFLRFLKQADRFDCSRNFSAWIHQVIKNQCLNTIRNRENRLRLIRVLQCRDGGDGSPSSEFDFRLLTQKIDRALEGFNARDRAIYRLRFEEELPIREIAANVGAPEGTVKSAIFHMLKKISMHLKEFIHE